MKLHVLHDVIAYPCKHFLSLKHIKHCFKHTLVFYFKQFNCIILLLFFCFFLKMDDDQDTREVLFPQWMGADKHGLTIEQKGQGEIFVKEVKDESPAAHTGKVHEGMNPK